MTPNRPAPFALPSLPAEITSYVGREREREDLLRLFESSRLVTLTGAAGSGKTRLALRIAADAEQWYADGAAWVELAALDDAPLVVRAVAQTLGVAEAPDRALLVTLLEALRPRQLLLVLDNCEHLLNACAELAAVLVRLPGIRILATSREPLQVSGEMRYPVSPLAMPDAQLSYHELAHVEAIRLFLDRAQAIVPAFRLTPDNAPQVAAICRRLDGMPLAIELVSAWVDVMTVDEIAARLDDRPVLLEATSPATRNPHRTMRAAMDWSYEMLTAAEQTVLRRLSVFAGGWSLAAAEAVCAVPDAPVWPSLVTLVHKSLVVAETLSGRATRYRLLEVVRQYAQDQLRAAHEWSDAHGRLLDAMVTWAEAAAPQLVGPRQQQALDEFDAESGNLRVALDWSLTTGPLASGARLAVALYQYWDRRGGWREGFGWFERINDRLDDQVTPGLCVQALAYGSFLAMSLNQLPAARRWSETALALCHGAADEMNAPLLSLALSACAGAALTAGDVARTYTLSGRILEMNRAAPDPLLLGMQLYIHGYLGIVTGRYETARADLEEALVRARQDDDAFRIALTLTALGNLARCEGRHAQASAWYGESLTRFRELGAAHEIPLTKRGLAFACLRCGDVPRAHALFLSSLDEMARLEDRQGILDGLRGCAALAAWLDQSAVCARLAGFVTKQMKGRPFSVDATVAADHLDIAVIVQRARAALGDAPYAAEEATGGALLLAQALELARALPPPAAVVSPADGLTPREREVAALVGHGLSNGEIASALVLSKRTVEKHIANLLSKLAFTQRAQIVRWAIAQNLTEPGNSA